MTEFNKKNTRVFRSTHYMRFSELDPYNHMNTAHYLTYFLEHRFHCMRTDLGWTLKTIADMPVAFITSSVKIDFARPVLPDQLFEISSHVEEFAEKSCRVLGEMKLPSGKIAATMELTLVCYDKAEQKVCTWPNEIIAAFSVT